MGFWTYFSSSSTSETVTKTDTGEIIVSTSTKRISEIQASSNDVVIVTNESHLNSSEKTAVAVQTPGKPPQSNPKRVSFRQAFSFPRTPTSATDASNQRMPRISRSDKRAQKNALRLKSLITGENPPLAPKVTPVVAKAHMDKLKTQLAQPKSANKLIAELRRLPGGDGSNPIDSGDGVRDGPIHAVCLAHTDAEEDTLHFAKLSTPASAIGVQSLSASEQINAIINEINIIDLIQAPDLGLGQPGDGKGLLAGAVPTAETVMNGAKQITPHLMTLGYTAGRYLVPDHSGIHPPTDRFSVLTYWWGLEVLMPPPTIEYLAGVQSVSGSVVNFLSALALVNNGVREILPFVRYIAQFVEFEFSTIKRQDQGKGVVCAATWLMPAALVPRPWDFPDPPSEDGVFPAPTSTTKEANETKGNTIPVTVPAISFLDIVTPPVVQQA
ncbi:hypothetical protein FA15DRAFT_673013 [Coprinopsis marcescibilis]|uniref:Uncharacterized protein n=1 Tax=Coprinopsis marcescibilis TaxID=230819 RepID=A0A5C3KLZ8_COPMA|nr:hypothetical protein FA15DRAFT_673013 [Coprinopsis marcescibilis]